MFYYRRPESLPKGGDDEETEARVRKTGGTVIYPSREKQMYVNLKEIETMSWKLRSYPACLPACLL
jgi:hypothetical protein